MENANTSFAFLTSDDATKYFAEVDILLKQGRHIQDYGSDSRLFFFIDEYYDRGLRDFYKQFFQINLERESHDNERYYYLDFTEDSKGKLAKDNRNKELESDRIIFAILLLNVYKEKFFEKKESNWQELSQIFKESEHKELWQELLFGKLKQNYTPQEEQNVKDKVRSIIKDFEKLGWVALKSAEDLNFEILPSIARISKLYSDVIENVEALDEYLNNE
jgi:hypothetical protein